MTNLTNVQVKVNLSTAKIKAGPHVSGKQVTELIASATSLADAETQALALHPGAIGAHATLPVVLGTSN